MTENAETSHSVDVRTIPHAQRHTIIFGILDELTPGARMEVTADHDPRPLRHHLETRFPGLFGWTYLDEGPDVWRVGIERLKPQGHECTCGGH